MVFVGFVFYGTKIKQSPAEAPIDQQPSINTNQNVSDYFDKIEIETDEAESTTSDSNEKPKCKVGEFIVDEGTVMDNTTCVIN